MATDEYGGDAMNKRTLKIVLILAVGLILFLSGSGYVLFRLGYFQAGNEYTVRPEDGFGYVYDSQNNKTGYTVILESDAPYHERGSLYLNGEYKGNIYMLKNDGQNRNQAAEYVKEKFADVTEKDFGEAVKSCFQKLKSREDYQTEIREMEKRCSEQGMMSYEVMAALLIYAQTGTLPDEESDDTYLGRPNIYMAPKKEIEQISSIRTRCGGAERVIQVVYANTSFLAGLKVTGEADSHWTASMGDLYATAKEIHMVLTDPESDAAKDAARYKMRPSSLRIPPEEIIAENLKDIRFTLPKYSDKNNIRVYLTDIALPCAYFQCEFKDHRRDNIKIDLYLPSFAEYEKSGEDDYKIKDENQSDGSQRQSFVIFRKNNPELYEVFSNNIREIVNHSNKIYGE